MPKISVILPTFNGERYIAQSIQSVIDQTEQDWELIIVNDCSTDNTLAICNEFAKKDNRITVVSNKTNKKLPASLNVGFARATGKYFTWTSDDNYYHPEALTMLAGYLDCHPKTDLVSMDFNFMNENDELMESYDASFRYKRCAAALLIGSNVGAAFMYRKTIADAVGEYDVNTFCAEDYDFWCRIALAGRIDYTSDRIYVYRRQSQSLTATKKDQVRKKTNIIKRKYADEFFARFNFTAWDRAKFYALVLKETPARYVFRIAVIKAYRTFVGTLCGMIFYPKLRRHIRASLLANDKFSFSHPNKEQSL
ncbi:glycosyltransferase family 2 protein [bacterium]|nr:glycosyltransferase family 2 protein [bacterium]